MPRTVRMLRMLQILRMLRTLRMLRMLRELRILRMLRIVRTDRRVRRVRMVRMVRMLRMLRMLRRVRLLRMLRILWMPRTVRMLLPEGPEVCGCLRRIQEVQLVQDVCESTTGQDVRDFQSGCASRQSRRLLATCTAGVDTKHKHTLYQVCHHPRSGP